MAGPMAAQAFYGRTDEAVVLALHGSVRYPIAQALRGVVDGIVPHSNDLAVVLDLRRMVYVDSTGLGLIARVGREVLTRTARRAVLVCAECDVAVTLRSAAFDELFVMTDELPFDAPANLESLPIETAGGPADTAGLGRVILEAHRDLAALSERNRDAYREVIETLEAELSNGRGKRPERE